MRVLPLYCNTTLLRVFPHGFGIRSSTIGHPSVGIRFTLVFILIYTGSNLKYVIVCLVLLQFLQILIFLRKNRRQMGQTVLLRIEAVVNPSGAPDDEQIRSVHLD